MKNLLLSVVLITALAFVFLACGGDDEEDDAFSFDGISGDLFTGSIITANGTGIAVYQWVLEDDIDTDLSTTATFTPDKVGKYTLYVMGNDGDMANVKFLVGPSDLKGTWYMNSASQTQIQGITAPTYNETVTITSNGYLLVAGSLQDGTPDGDHYTFAISNWEKEGGYQITIPTTSSGFSSFASITKFPVAETYKVSGKFEDVHGYATGDSVGTAPFTDTYLYIRFNPTDKQFFRSIPANKSSSSTSLLAVERFFENTKKGTWAE
jgi:hypothetical protein